jgi:hypothetical protein
MRLHINNEFTTYYSKIHNLGSSGDIIGPSSYLFKESTKISLLKANLIEDFPIQKLPLISIETYKKEKALLINAHQWIADTHVRDVVNGQFAIQRRGGDIQELMKDLHFFTLESKIITDFSYLINNYEDSLPHKFKPHHGVSNEATNVNTLEFTYQIMQGLSNSTNSYSELKSATNLNYIIFMIVNLLLTALGTVIIYWMSDRITKDLHLMASLLLKIDKNHL